MGTFGNCDRGSQFLPTQMTDMRIPPWFVAVVVLLIVSFAGAYIVNSFPEGFSVISQRASAACEAAYQACISSGQNQTDFAANVLKNQACTNTYNTCELAANAQNTDVNRGSTTPSYYSLWGDISDNTADPDYYKIRVPRYDSLQSEVLPQNGATSDTEYNDIQGGAPVSGSNVLTDSLSSAAATISAGLAASTIAPATGGQDSQTAYATTSPAQRRIYPHQHPLARLPTMTASGGQTPSSSTSMASVRQMIRDDVKHAIHDEMKGVRNEYEISYDADECD